MTKEEVLTELFGLWIKGVPIGKEIGQLSEEQAVTYIGQRYQTPIFKFRCPIDAALRLNKSLTWEEIKLSEAADLVDKYWRWRE